MAKKFYAYLLLDGNISGIVNSWDECKNLVHGRKARYKGFGSEKDALEWLDNGAEYEKKAEKKKEVQEILPNAIYFDSGTGRGIGVEVRVSGADGNSLLHFNSYGYQVNEFGNIHLGKSKTNNYGELLGLYLAIDIAQQCNCTHILGDSNLVIYYWSRGMCNKSTLPDETVELIEKVVEARKRFEKNGGIVKYISGDYNPADLGFHK
ncbi:viroplasmin family protein [Fusobacterium sp.]|uniref:ribonuclease H1 domain-containing protein n=1 Tax=Fusobacterium sp. TaxID=68766 RepID=UPI00396C86AE